MAYIPTNPRPDRVGCMLPCSHMLEDDELADAIHHERCLCGAAWPQARHLGPMLLARLCQPRRPEPVAKYGALRASVQAEVPYAGELEYGTRRPGQPEPERYLRLLDDIERAGGLAEVGKALRTHTGPTGEQVQHRLVTPPADAVYRVEQFVDDWHGRPADESPPWLLRIELWWMRQRLRWAGRDGVRLHVYVPNAVPAGRTWSGLIA
jgi:hypothetical protein